MRYRDPARGYWGTIAEQLACSLMLLGFVPMHSDSQRFVSIPIWATAFTAITRVQIPSGTPNKSITYHDTNLLGSPQLLDYQTRMSGHDLPFLLL